VGEAQLGLIDGVVSTKSGWLARREVVEVAFDPRTLDYGDLVGKAEKARCVSPVFTRDDGQHAIAKRLVGKDAVRNDDPVRADKDTKFYLKKNLLRFVPLTGPQASRINGHLGVIGGKKGLEAATALLSPRQLELYASIREHPRAGWKSAVGRAFPEAWSEAEAIRRGLTEKRPKGRGDR
jgi:hypothetical protein